MALLVWTQAGHVPYWDGERWTCPAEGCAFDSTTKDGLAQHHYFVQLEEGRLTEEPALD